MSLVCTLHFNAKFTVIIIKLSLAHVPLNESQPLALGVPSVLLPAVCDLCNLYSHPGSQTLLGMSQWLTLDHRIASALLGTVSGTLGGPPSPGPRPHSPAGLCMLSSPTSLPGKNPICVFSLLSASVCSEVFYDSLRQTCLSLSLRSVCMLGITQSDSLTLQLTVYTPVSSPDDRRVVAGTPSFHLFILCSVCTGRMLGMC